VASYVGSTKGMIDYVRSDLGTEFIVATEVGILHEMRKQAPEKLLIPAPAHEDNTCACSECPYMKMNTLEKLRNCLLYEAPEVHVNETIRQQAARALQHMLKLS
jgi:quinolinate synthase